MSKKYDVLPFCCKGELNSLEYTNFVAPGRSIPPLHVDIMIVKNTFWPSFPI